MAADGKRYWSYEQVHELVRCAVMEEPWWDEWRLTLIICIAAGGGEGRTAAGSIMQAASGRHVGHPSPALARPAAAAAGPAARGAAAQRRHRRPLPAAAAPGSAGPAQGPAQPWLLLQSRRSLLAVLLAALGSGAARPGSARARAAPAPRTSTAGDNVGLLSDAEVDRKRKKGGFLRAHDGHVAIQSRYTKAWVDIKCDLQVPGLLLLREPGGQVYYLGYAGLKQVDLSDDTVVQAVAADDWEDSMRPVQAETQAGGVEGLVMSREDFYALVSLTSDEDAGAPAEAGGGAGGGTGGGRRGR
ncbi:hypothetical protein HT031_003576 [Scenedesmus sp. PABB004]|nr:hypothetical protein HT031_003576 [Scenedesmus sp. PABB004]